MARRLPLLFHSFTRSLVDPWMCPDQRSNLQPWRIRITLQPAELPARAPLVLTYNHVVQPNGKEGGDGGGSTNTRAPFVILFGFYNSSQFSDTSQVSYHAIQF